MQPTLIARKNTQQEMAEDLKVKADQVNENGEFFDKIVRDYRIIKPIGKLKHRKLIVITGEGKFSVVFKAFKISDNTPVALKILKVKSVILKL